MTMTGQTALAASDASYSPYTSTFAGVTLITSAGVTCTGRYAEKMRPILPACLRLKPLFRNWSSIISPSTRSWKQCWSKWTDQQVRWARSKPYWVPSLRHGLLSILRTCRHVTMGGERGTPLDDRFKHVPGW